MSYSDCYHMHTVLNFSPLTSGFRASVIASVVLGLMMRMERSWSAAILNILFDVGVGRCSVFSDSFED